MGLIVADGLDSILEREWFLLGCYRLFLLCL
jgi:hypothetical protein